MLFPRRMWTNSVPPTSSLKGFIDTLCNIIIAAVAVTAITYTYLQLNDLEESDKRKAALEHIFRLGRSTSENTRPALRLIRRLEPDSEGRSKRVLNAEIAFKIIRGEPFKINFPGDLADAGKRAALKKDNYDQIPGSDNWVGYSHLTSDTGVIDAKTANELRFSLVKYFNAWDSLILAAWEGRADCQLLFDDYIKVFSERSYFSVVNDFTNLYVASYGDNNTDSNSETSISWLNIRKLFKYKSSPWKQDSKCFCSYKAATESGKRSWQKWSEACKEGSS